MRSKISTELQAIRGTDGESGQTARYIEELQSFCRQLAETPTIGRACEAVRPGLRRMEAGSHVVFYRIGASGITVSRILHRKMLPDLHER